MSLAKKRQDFTTQGLKCCGITPRIVQKYKSHFRIITNGGQCISCGNCSIPPVRDEMGIDVRWYAERGQNVIRASCVGCGVCAAACPRGVLALENGPEEGRYGRVEMK